MKNKSKIVSKHYANYKSEISEFHNICCEVRRLIVNLFDREEEKFVYCSRSVKQVLGYQPKALVGSGWEFWYSLLKPKERPVVRHKLSRVVYDDSPDSDRNGFTTTYHVKNSEGDWSPVRHEISHRMFDGEFLVVSFIYDDSERELIERYFDNSEEFKFESDTRPSNDISDREKQVLKLIACGLSSKKIAKKLYISRHTVISHRKNLIRKFRVKNTAELVKEASKTITL